MFGKLSGKKNVDKSEKTPKKVIPKKINSKAKQVSNKQMVALDIGSKTTKLITGKFKGSRISVDIMSGTVNTKGSAYNGKILNMPEVIRVVKKLVSASGVSLKDIVYTVESSGLIRREMDIPNVPMEDVLGTITYQMSEYLPIDINSYVLQVKPIGSFKEGGNKRRSFSVGALPKDIVETYINFSDTLGVDHNSMDINSNAIEKLLQLEIKADNRNVFKNKTLVFIDMGHSFFNIAIYSNGKYLFNRMVEIGGGMIDAAIASRMRIPEDEAERIKINNGSKYSVLDLMHKFSRSDSRPDSIEGIVLSDTLKIYEKWASEINQVLNYFTTRDRSNQIDEIYLYGGCSFINGIDEYLERRLQLPTNAFVDFKCVELNSQELNRNILNYLNPIGALIRI